MNRASSQPTALIFGISGQDGSYLARYLLDQGYRVHGASREVKAGTFKNLAHLGIEARVQLHSCSLMDFRGVVDTITRVEPREIYNLGGQSSVAVSFSQPVETMESIAIATLNVLEAIRVVDPTVRFYNAASSECFGETDTRPADETTTFRPRSPYAVAKAAAHWAVVNYREAYGLRACSGILFNHESPLRHSNFVTRKIASAAVRTAAGVGEKLQLGNLTVERDWGWAPEYVEAIWRILQHDPAGDFVVATGESHSLEEFVDLAFACCGLDWRQHVSIDEALFRPSDIRRSRGNPGRAAQVLGWKARTHIQGVVENLIHAEQARMRGEEGWVTLV